MKTAGALAVAVFLGLAAPAFGQSRTITGKVVDTDGRPVAGASVEITNKSGALVGFVKEQRADSQTWRATTDRNGNYGVVVPISGVYLLVASKERVGTDQTEVAVGFDSVSSINLRLSMPPIRPPTGLECSTTASSAAPSQNKQSISSTHPALDQLLRWLDAVETHAPGCSDAALFEVSRWSPGDFETLLGNLTNIAAFHTWIREKSLETSSNARSSVESLTGTGLRVAEARFIRDGDRTGAIVIQNRRFSNEELEEIFKGNDTLRRGALLHADIAVFVPGNFRQYPTVNDGHRQSGRRGTFHWQIGRQLLDMISPGPADDGGAHLWYRAVTAHLFHQGNLAEVEQHLQKARQVFARDPQVLLDSAVLHLEFSSPAVQAAVDELRAERAETAVETRRAELQIAERFLRETLAVAPADAGAHSRLGYILGELGRHVEAVAELRAAIDARPDREQRYLTELFLGREQQALGHVDQAKRHYENAAVLFPDAQSPHIALTFLARVSGNRAGALDALRPVTDRPTDDRADPWHTFYKAHWSDAEPLMREMQEQLGGSR